VHRLERLDLALRPHAQLRELTRAGQYLAFQRADSRVEGLDAGRQVAAQLREVTAEHSEALVQLLGERPDRFGILREHCLPPAVGDGLQDRDEARRRRDYYVLPDRVLDQRRQLRERRRQELIARDEQDDEVRALLELIPVVLRAELSHALRDGLGVPAQ